MPGFSSFDDYVSEAYANGKQYDLQFYKTAPAAAEAAGVWQALRKGAGTPGAGTDPAATPGTAYTGTESAPIAGCMSMPDVSTDQKYGILLDCVANQNCNLALYDLLVGVSGISLASTGNKTVNSTALPRYSGTASVPVECWLEVTTATTTTAPVVSLNSYTSADGSTAQSGGTVTFPATATDLHTLVRVPTSATKPGIRSVEVGLNVATAAAAGAVNLLLMRRLTPIIPLIANQGNTYNLLTDFPTPKRIFDGACIIPIILASGAVTTTIWGGLQVAYG